VTAIAAGLGAALFIVLSRRTARAAIEVLPWTLVVIMGLLAPDFTRSSGLIPVTLLQGNIAQDEKFDTRKGVIDALVWYGRELQSASTELVLAPETALPVLPHQLPDGYLDAIASIAQRQSSVKLVGIPMGNHQTGYTNSVIAMGGPDETIAYRYDKSHLVPFGEFIPPFFKWFVRMMSIPLGDFNRGGLQQASLTVRGQLIAPSICYEDLFAEELAKRFEDGSKSPTIFANFSNLAWFGDSTAMYQHLHISRLRSIEFGRPFLRVSNTGVTSIVDHQGRVTHQIQPFIRSAMTGVVEGRTGLTPFAYWSAHWGQWPWWIVSMGVLLWAWKKPMEDAR
jgi:apolipoprotein N-acyltransferase